MNKNVLKSNTGGFTLIEMMIVVEIIAILVAIGLPNYLRTRIQANEAAAIGNLKVVMDAQTTYNTANYVYSDTFDDLIEASPAYLDKDLRLELDGYTYTMDEGGDGFAASALPVEFGVTGYRGFRIDNSGIIRYAVGGAAGPEDPPIWD